MRIGLGFQSAMLTWPKGGDKDDGPWAPHWHESARGSTGFGKPAGNNPQISNDYRDLLNMAQPFYDMMADQKI